MPIDHAGTKPGLTPQEEEPEQFNMRCKSYPECDSMLVIEMKHPGIPPGSRMYQCCKCKRTFGMAVGGAVEL